MALIEFALIVSAIALFTITETYEPYVTVGLGLLVIFFAERGVRGSLISAHSGLELPIFLFIVSAGIATGISFNQGAALLQFARILGAAALFFALADSRSPFPELFGFGFLLATAFLAIYWPLKNDFIEAPGKLVWITSIGQWLNAHLAPIPGPTIHNNVAAGVLVVGLPIGAALSWQAWKARRFESVILTAMLGLIVVFGLIMTSSRGALTGLGALLIIFGLVLIQKRVFTDRRSITLYWLAILVLALSVFTVIVAGNNLALIVGQIPDPSGTMRSRLSLWQESLGLIRDYLFTGSGLQTYWMVHSIYGILIHTPFIAHSHNSFLQVWIEQGAVGAIAVVWGSVIVLIWAWKAMDQSNIHPLGWAGLAAIFVASVHGLVDVVFYVERTLPIVGLLLGFAALTRRGNPNNNPSNRKTLKAQLATAAVLGLSIGGIYFRRPIAAAWYANLGAISQTRTELSVYDPEHFDNPTMDEIRQNLDLNAAQTEFERSISIQNDNITSLQRQSEIALSRGNYAQALEWMRTAWEVGNRDTVTRLLYGDALVAAGQIDLAAQLIKGTTWAESRLMGQAFYRYLKNRDFERSKNAWETVILLNPSNTAAASELAKIQNLLNP